MTTARTRIVTGMDTGRELLNWYIADPGDEKTILGVRFNKNCTQNAE